MLTLKDYTPQNTKGIAGLSNQLCAEAVSMGFLAEVKINEISCDGDSLVHLYLHPTALKKLLEVTNKLDGSNGESLIISTAYRTLAQQFILKQNLPGLVANVGRSDHGNGRSLDITNYDKYESILSGHGWTQSYPSNDPVHWDCDDVPDNRSMTVQAFQRLYNRNNPKRSIGEDGRVGANTLRALANSPACGFANALTPRWLSLGDVGKDVAKYQLILRNAKLYSGAYDGVYGSGMQKAVIDFQTRYKLSVTGIIGNITGGRLCDYPDVEVPV
jgi:Putative peptidoglycan binding domain